MLKYILVTIVFITSLQIKAEEFQTVHGKCFSQLQQVLKTNFSKETLSSKKFGLSFFNQMVYGNYILQHDDNGGLIIYGANKQSIQNRGCEVNNSENAISTLSKYLRDLKDILKNKNITPDHEMIRVLSFCEKADGTVGEAASEIKSQLIPQNYIKPESTSGTK